MRTEPCQLKACFTRFASRKLGSVMLVGLSKTEHLAKECGTYLHERNYSVTVVILVYTGERLGIATNTDAVLSGTQPAESSGRAV